MMIVIPVNSASENTHTSGVVWEVLEEMCGEQFESIKDQENKPHVFHTRSFPASRLPKKIQKMNWIW